MDISYTLARGETHDSAITLWTIEIHSEIAAISGLSGTMLSVPVSGTLPDIALSLASAAPEAFLIAGSSAYAISCSPEFEKILPLILRADNHEIIYGIELEGYESDADYVLVNGKQWAAVDEAVFLPCEEGVPMDPLESSWGASITYGNPDAMMYVMTRTEIGEINSLLGMEIYNAYDEDYQYRVFPLDSPLDHLLEFASNSLIHDAGGYIGDGHPRGEKALEQAFIDVLEHSEWVAEPLGFAYLMPPTWLDEVLTNVLVTPEWYLRVWGAPELKEQLLKRLHENNPGYSTELSDYPVPDVDAE